MEPTAPLPRNLAVLETAAGASRAGLKVLIYGRPKTGKSFCLASFPGPRFVLACGESGIEPYLDKAAGDRCLGIHGGNDLLSAIDYVMNLTDCPWKSLLVDNVNLAWEDYMDDKQEELGVDEIRGGLWKRVKGPWRAMVRKMMRSPIHVGMSAWIKDILYVQEGAAPGIEGRTRIMEQDNPHVEKTLLYAPDLIFKTDFVLDAKAKPTSIHKVIYYGGRRPRSVPASQLYTGREWKFDSKNPVNVWDTTIAPVYEKWREGEVVDFLGVDPVEAQEELRAMRDAEMDQILGRVLLEMGKATDMPTYRAAFESVQGDYALLDQPRRDRVMETHKMKKAEFEARG